MTQYLVSASGPLCFLIWPVAFAQANFRLDLAMVQVNIINPTSDCFYESSLILVYSVCNID